jgi:quinol monooxygenase YgiN
MGIRCSKCQPDTCVSIAPYFLIGPENEEDVKVLLKDFVAKTQREEPKCMYYSFTRNDKELHCREGYTDADGLLNHLENVGELLSKLQTLASVTRFEVHGPSSELDKLKEPLKDMNPSFFVIECGFRK